MKDGVRYKLVFSKNMYAVLDSVCAIKKAGIYTITEDTDNDLEFITRLDVNTETQFNVIAVLENNQIAIPYKPITLKVPQRQVFGGRLIIVLLTAVVIIFGILALYFFFKGKKLEHKLNEEVREFANVDGGSRSKYHKVNDDGGAVRSDDF